MIGPETDEELLADLAAELSKLSALVAANSPEVRSQRHRLVRALLSRSWLLDLAFWLLRRGPAEGDAEEGALLNEVFAAQAEERRVREHVRERYDKKK